MARDWLRELARDLVAFGSIPFYIIVIARSTIGNHQLFVYQTIIALILLTAISIFVKGNMHIARGFVLFGFTSLFYYDLIFALFAFMLWLATLVSLFYLKKKTSMILKGVAIGVVCFATAYYVTPKVL